MIPFCSLVLALALGGAHACVGPNANQPTVDLIKKFESFDPNIYTDAGGNPTVGYGHLCADSSCSDVPYAIPLSDADGEQLLKDDLKGAQDCITNATAEPVVLNADQYGALVSWAFNVGCGNVGSSTLIQRLNDGEDPNTVAADELPQWNKSNGEVLDGLVKRRAAEVDLFQTPTDEGALPAPC